MKVLHTEWSMGWGGQEMRIVSECEAFRRKGMEMVVAARPGSGISRECGRCGIPVVRFPFRSPLDFPTVVSLARYLAGNGFHVVHTHSSVDSWCGALAGRLAGVPVVRSRHLSAPVGTGWSARLLYCVLADRVITSGEAIRERMISVNRFPPHRLVSIPAGVDETRFHPGVDPTAVQREFGLGPGDFVVGIVAILRSWKGHLVLLEAVHEVRSHIRNVKLLIVGDGPYRETLERRTRELGLEEIVLFSGFRRDVPELLAAMDLFVLPSTGNEATSQVIPQAMLMEVPVIASTAGGLSEVVEHRCTGMLVPPNDPRALAEAIRFLHSDPQRAASMARAARRRALRLWTFDSMIAKTEAVYRAVVEEAAGWRRKRRIRPRIGVRRPAQRNGGMPFLEGPPGFRRTRK